MKQNIIHTLWVAAVLPLLLVSCQQEELPGMNGTSDLTPLAITVTDGGYAPADGRQKTVTRATENGYRTDFTAGDECGLYIVRDGKTVYENVKLTATAGWGGLTWRPEKAIAGGMDGESYFLYYPYQADMTGKTNASATDDSDFFAPLISGWLPAADQRDYATGYAAGDLMTATGTAAKGTNGMRQLSFSMTHRMALAIVEIPKTVYKFSDTSIPDYVMTSTTDFGNGAKPYCCMDGTYRYLVRDGQGSDAATLTGYYADGKREFAITPNNIDANTYKVYKVDGLVSIEKNYDLQPGDYFCKNSSNTWYIIPKTETPGSECIGVVFYTGHHPQDKSDYSSTGIGQKKCHGYVVALQDATNSYCIWGKNGTELGLYPKENPDGYSYRPVSLDWSGYSYTQTIILAAGGKENLNATEQEGYPATYYAVVDYEKDKAQAPSGSSGWFLPSIGQMWKISELRSVLFAPKSVATDLKSSDYWSSSEDYISPARAAYYFLVYSGYAFGRSKDVRDCYVRPVLAF